MPIRISVQGYYITVLDAISLFSNPIQMQWPWDLCPGQSHPISEISVVIKGQPHGSCLPQAGTYPSFGDRWHFGEAAENRAETASRQYCQGFFSLAYCSRQNQSIGEVMRRAAKNTEGVTDFLCAALGGRALCSRKSLWWQTSTGTRHYWIHLPGFWPRNVYKCRVMYTNVYVCRANFSFLGRYFASYRTVPRRPWWIPRWRFGYISQRFSWWLSPASFLWARAVASQFVRLECPQCGPVKGTSWIQAAFRGLVRIRCNYPGSGRPKSTQVDL